MAGSPKIHFRQLRGSDYMPFLHVFDLKEPARLLGDCSQADRKIDYTSRGYRVTPDKIVNFSESR